MNGKLVVAMLLSGLIVAFTLYLGNYMYGAPELSEDALEDDGDGEDPWGVDMDGAVDGEGDPSGDDLPADFEYYQAELADRYAQYQLAQPDLDAGEVVWHVNAGLDQEPYTLAAAAEEDHPLLVNKRYKLPDDYEPPELVEIHGNVRATPGTAEAFQRMRAAAMLDGIYIEAAGGYRSLERQQELFEAEERYKGTEAAEAAVARPGYGEHSTGRALHIVDRDYTFDGFETLPEYAWLVEHGPDYGFILRYGENTSHITGFDYEPYHFTFVGRETALDMVERDIATLEEYAARGLAADSHGPIDDRTTVVIVPGYSAGGEEDTYANDLARRVEARLAEENLRVVITRNSREIKNEQRAAALIGIDRAAASRSTVVWFDSGRAGSRDLAETVGSRLSWSGLDADSHGIYEDSKVALMRFTDAPGALVELSDENDPAKAAKSISDGIIAHLGIRKMYLTFDDGPSAKNTPEVLEILREKGVKATFFVVGEMAERNPDLLKQIADEGHAIGIHCYSHDYNVLYESVQSFVDDFYKAREVVREITGIEPVIYRFPGGSINHYNKEVYQQIIEEMDRLGFAYFDWNISVDDAVGSVQTGDLMKTVKATLRSRYAVLLMHDAYPYIARELSDVIDYFSDYQMNVIEDDTTPVHL